MYLSGYWIQGMLTSKYKLQSHIQVMATEPKIQGPRVGWGGGGYNKSFWPLGHPIEKPHTHTHLIFCNKNMRNGQYLRDEKQILNWYYIK